MSAVDLLTVKELMGHRSINMTLRYAPYGLTHERQAVESLRVLNGHNLVTRTISEQFAHNTTY